MKHFFVLVCLGLFITCCSKRSGDKGPAPFVYPDIESIDEFGTEAKAFQDQLISKHLEGGYVVSRLPDGTPEHWGDSLLFSGLALAVLSCEKGEPILSAILNSIEKRGGQLVRFEPTPKTRSFGITSRDMETGAMFGLVSRAKRCPKDFDRIAAGWRRHDAFVKANGYFLEDSPEDLLTPGMMFIFELVSQHFLGAPEPKGFAVFNTAIYVTTLSTVVLRKACYPLHLEVLELWLAKALGKEAKAETMHAFCRYTDGADVPLIDWLCSRKDASLFFKNFKKNEWHYRHQRCGVWEKPDGGESDNPSLDFLLLQHFTTHGF